MASNDRAIGYLELNSKQWDEALAAAQKTLAAFGVALTSYKVADFFKEGIEGAIKFGNEAYFAAQKLNGYDPGKLFIVQKALQAAGLSAEEARDNIEAFGRAGKPLETLFKGGDAGLSDALARSAKEYGTQAAVLTKSAEEFAYVQGQITAVGIKLQGFFLGLADKIAGPLSGLLSEIDKIDLVGMGEKFGGYVVNAIDTVRGLAKNGDLFSALGLSLKVGFEVAVDFLLNPKLWSGIAKVAVGSLAVIGTFLTSVFLGIGKILVATIEAAFERLREKYGPLLAIVSPVAGLANALGAKASTDVGVNLANIENGSLVQSQERGASLLNNRALAVAMGGINDVLKSGKSASLSASDLPKLQDLLTKAMASGAAQSNPNGTKNPIYNLQADPVHVIADSLARVGGGGRYVRTGLSIADKAALDNARFSKQQADLQAKWLPVIAAKSGAKVAMGGG